MQINSAQFAQSQPAPTVATGSTAVQTSTPNVAPTPTAVQTSTPNVAPTPTAVQTSTPNVAPTPTFSPTSNSATTSTTIATSTPTNSSATTISPTPFFNNNQSSQKFNNSATTTNFSQSTSSNSFNKGDNANMIQKIINPWNLIFFIIITLTIGLVTRFALMSPSTIAVTGKADIEFVPNKVAFVVVKNSVGINPTQVIAQGDSVTNSLIETVRNTDANAKIRKAYANAQVIDTGGEVPGYMALNTFSVESNQVESIDELISTLYTQGADSVSSVVFSSDDDDSLLQQARKEAIQDARNSAGKIAKAAGKRVGRVLVIEDDERDISGSVSLNNAEDSSKQMTISKQVSVTYTLW